MRKSLYLFFLVIGAFIGLSQNNALVLNGAYIRLNGGTVTNPVFMVVNQPQITGIIRPGGGHIHSENQYNHVRWVASTTIGNYIFPLGVGGTAADYIPFEFNKTTAGNANITVSTFSTNAGNIPFATPVSSMPQAPSSIDRFWDIRSTSTVTANLTFRYRGIENTVSTCATDTVKAQFWNNPAGPWSSMFGPGNPGVTAGIGTVGSISGQTYFQPTETVWALTTVTISPNISASSSITCNGSNNGSATVTTTGGLGPYTFSWSPTTNTSSVATGLTPGTHTVTVTGANSCSKTTTINITQPPAITLTVNQSQVTCTALASATVNPAGGTTTYTAYTWSPVVSNTNTATGLSAGSYTATVTDNNGCQQSTSMTITSNTSSPVVTASSSGSLNCTTTTVQTIASTTTSPVSYTWAGVGIVSGANTASATVNTGGSFDYTVTNTSNGCSTTGSQVITQNTVLPTLTLSPMTATLSCTNPTVQLTATTTDTDVSYAWTTNGSLSSTTLSNPIATGNGTYNVIITNTITGCQSNSTTTVTSNTVPPTLTLSPISYTVTCSSPTVQLTATSTATDVSYAWTTNGNLSSATISNPIAAGNGTYNVVITNTITGCQSNQTATLTGNTTPPTLTLSPMTYTLSCANPTVQLTAFSTDTDINYAWTTNGSLSNTSISNPIATGSGTYNIMVTNTITGCQSSQTTTLTSNATSPTLTLSPMTYTLSCSNPTVQLTAFSTDTDINYTWTTNGSVSNTTISNPIAAGNGTYNVLVTNTLTGCQSNATATLTSNAVPPTLTLSPMSFTLTCTTPTVQLTAITTDSNVIYAWSTNGSLGNVSIYNPVATGNGTYNVIVTNTVTGCQSNLTATVISNTAPATLVVSNTVIPCGSPTVSIGAIATPTNVTYNWTTSGAGTLLSAVNMPNAIVGSSGQYSVTVTNNTNGCVSTAVVNVTTASVTAAFTANPLSGVAPLDVNFTNQSTGANTYSWNFGDITSVTNISAATNPSHTFNTIGSYVVILVATDATGLCSDTARVTIDVLESSSIMIPNVFTPNGDHSNDVFKITSTGLETLHCDIFNRWGLKLFTIDTVNGVWDGSAAPDGTYFYILKAKGFDGKEIEQQGFISLFR